MNLRFLEREVFNLFSRNRSSFRTAKNTKTSAPLSISKKAKPICCLRPRFDRITCMWHNDKRYWSRQSKSMWHMWRKRAQFRKIGELDNGSFIFKASWLSVTMKVRKTWRNFTIFWRFWRLRNALWSTPPIMAPLWLQVTKRKSRICKVAPHYTPSTHVSKWIGINSFILKGYDRLMRSYQISF